MRGIAYQIIHIHSRLIYVGSTINTLSQRWASHKSQFKEYLKNKRQDCSLNRYFETYGVNNFKIIQIKEYEICDRIHLRAYEQLWINKLKSCNKHDAFSIKILSKRFSAQLYRKTNKDKVYQLKRGYRERNKEAIKVKKREYYNKNKQNYVDKRKIKVNCECGSTICKSDIYIHNKSKKHQIFIITQLFQELPFMNYAKIF